MKIKEIAFFGYPVTDLQRAKRFYEGVLGLKPTHVFGDDKSAWIEYDIGAATLAIGNGAPEWKPNAGGGCVALEIEDITAALKTLAENQVQHRPPMETPACSVILLADPDGNSLMLHKRKGG